MIKKIKNSNKKSRVLIVDDDESILDALSLILNDEGYLTEAATKGEETLKKISHFKPDIILLDILMSGKDGREICKEIKSNENTKGIPVFLISAHPSASKSYKQYGAEEFLAKPFETKALLDLIVKYTT